MPINWALAGPGKIAKQVASDLAGIDRYFFGVASSEPSKAAEFADSYGVQKVYKSYQQMFSDEAIGAVYIANINPQHYPLAKLALQAGKHVLVEKPFTLNAIQARELQEIANSNSLVVMEALWSRFLEHWLALPEITKNLGEVKSVEADFSVNISHVERLTNPKLGGGALLDLGVYPLSLIQMLLGKADSIEVNGELQGGVDKNLRAKLSYSGAKAIFTTGFDSDGPVEAKIVCSDGHIEIGKKFYEQATIRVFAKEGNQISEITPNHPGRGMQQQFLWFEQVIKEGRLEAEIFTQRDSLDVMEMMDDIRNQLGVIYPGE